MPEQRRNRRRVRPDRTEVRTRILDAARAEFAASGYRGTSLDRVARAAGFSKGAVYSNFASKDELFLALLAEELQSRAERLAATAGRRKRTLRGDIDALARVLCTMVSDEWQANAVFAEFRASAMHDPELLTTLGQVRAAITQAVAVRLADYARAHGVRLAMPAPQAATILLALVNGLSLEQIGRPDPVVSARSLSTVLAGFVVA